MNWQIQFTGPRCQHSLALPSTGISVVFGSSGSGKTTLLHALAGIDRQPGSVQFGDQLWQNAKTFLGPAQRQLGMVFQEARLLPHLSVADNIRLGGHAIAPERWRHWCDLLGITALLPQAARGLSGGEQQRVALARALLKPSQALLLDEPFNGLDRQRRITLVPALRAVAQHKPLVLVTHQLDELLALADHLVLMDDQGSASGPAAALLNHPLITQQRGHVYSVLRGRRQPGGGQDLHDFTLADGQTLRITAHPAVDSPFIAVDARDVSLSLSRATDSSILNIMAAAIERIDAPVLGVQQVHLRVADQALVAQLSCHSVAHLALCPGMPVFAQIKGTAFVGR